jgi:glycosyltransferase involved in cell wall biosynthesis
MYTGVVTLAAFNMVLDAFVEVANRFPKAVFVYVGDSVSRTEVARSIGSNGLEGKVLLTGSVEHRVIHKYMAAADILFQLSLGEEIDEYRFPTKIPEYFAMGKPVITFAHGAGRIFEDGVHVLKHDGTPGEIARQIAILLTNPELRQRLGANARRKAEELFDWKKNVQHLSNVYAEVIAT